jgi:hypothetical protein
MISGEPIGVHSTKRRAKQELIHLEKFNSHEAHEGPARQSRNQKE